MSKEKKAAKAEKKAAKKAAKTPMDVATKDAIVKSITAFVCVVAICITSTVAIGKYSTAVVDAAKSSGTGAGAGAAATDTNTPGGDDATPADGTAVDGATDPIDGTDATPADGTDASGDAAADGTTAKADGGSSSGSGTSVASNDVLKYTKAQIVEYYNSCLKKSYSQPKLTVTKTEQISITVDSVTGGTVVKNIANSIVKKYATATEKHETFTNGKAASGTLASDYALPTKLVAGGAKSATIKKSGSGYEINITVVSENSVLGKQPVYNAQCSYPLKLEEVDLSPAKVTQADFTYSGTTLKLIVDSKGRATKATVLMPLKGTGAGAAVGITITANVHGSWSHTSTYTF